MVASNLVLYRKACKEYVAWVPGNAVELPDPIARPDVEDE